MHTFLDSVGKTNTPEVETLWNQAYRSFFGSDLSGTIFVKDRNEQNKGIDRVIVLIDGRQITTEEKLRFNHYTKDILLEYEHSDGWPGWIEKPISADYLAYGWEPTREVYLLPTVLLQRAWAKFKDDWHGQAGTRENGFRYCHADNPRYRSSSIAVPLPILLDAILKVSYLKF